MPKPYIRDNPRQHERKYNPLSYQWAQMQIIWELMRQLHPELPFEALENMLIEASYTDMSQMEIQEKVRKFLQKERSH